MSDTPELRVADLDQYEAIYALMLEVFAPYVKKLREEATSGPYPILKSAIENGDVYVCLIGGEVVGVADTVIQGNNLLINQIGISRKIQNQGIGSWLLDQVEQVAVKKNMKSMSLQTAEMMEDLLQFYKRHGFVETHRALPDHGEDEHLRVHFTKLI